MNIFLSVQLYFSNQFVIRPNFVFSLKINRSFLPLHFKFLMHFLQIHIITKDYVVVMSVCIYVSRLLCVSAHESQKLQLYNGYERLGSPIG